MNKSILNTVIQEFINNNLYFDITKLLLQNPQFDQVSIKEIVEQIEAKKKCKTKLPTWFSSENIYYPNKLNIEQTSSEATAQYKSELVSGQSLIDLTGGFGVDAYYFSKQVKEVTHCEINENLSEIASHNFIQLEAPNIKSVHTDGMTFIKKESLTYDWIYVDPSRRHDSKGKVFFLKDCLPNIPEHLNTLFEYSKHILIKTSPLLDIKAGLGELHAVKEIHIVALHNHVKELLWVLKKNHSEDLTIKTVNLKKDSEEAFAFKLHKEKEATASLSEPLTYLYQPNAALLKSGAFKLISERLAVKKLNINTHLYTSSTLVNFPGRRFKIEKLIPYNKKLLKKEFSLYNKANVSSRNFPETVDQLKRKFKLGDGGSNYLFFTTDMNNQKIVLVCSKT